jgi:hypothetical protein
VPGAVKYGDMPGLIELCAPLHPPCWVRTELKAVWTRWQLQWLASRPRARAPRRKLVEIDVPRSLARLGQFMRPGVAFATRPAPACGGWAAFSRRFTHQDTPGKSQPVRSPCATDVRDSGRSPTLLGATQTEYRPPISGDESENAALARHGRAAPSHATNVN